MEEKRKAFDEFGFTATTALGDMMTCEEVGCNPRALLKISRFRMWLMGFISAEQEPRLPFKEDNV